MRRHGRHPVAAILSLVALAWTPAFATDLELETYTLPNGMTVILHPDHTLPQVVVDTWFSVGSKDDPPQRSGFAHLFEHLMFMGTERVPGSGYDDTMEAGGGANNAGTGMDRTSYFSWGPSSLLPTLLWLDADRLDGLARAMTQQKLDLQRDVVLNERRENYENSPYGVAEFIIPEALYPEGHPYHNSGIGEPEHLEAATVDDVVSFFNTFYVPGNASMVVAGDFDPEVVRRLVAQTFGAIPAKPLPSHRVAPPASLGREVRRLATDRVEAAKLYLVWPSPAIYAPGDAEMDLIADLLGDGPSSRLHQRLIITDRSAREVEVYQVSQLLGSQFHIEVTASSGADLEEIKRAVLEEIAALQADGPTAAELTRVKAAVEADFLRGMENLIARAESLNSYRFHFGDPDSFERDLARWTTVEPEDIVQWAQSVLVDGRLDLRILPLDAAVDGADLDRRPEDFSPAPYQPPRVESFVLANGIPVALVHRPDSGLFQGALVVDGGDALVPAARAGLAALTARMLTAGAAGRTASQFAESVASLGADITASAGTFHSTVTVRGLTSRLQPTLDLFADAVLRPNLAATDFDRERGLALDQIRSRSESPQRIAFITENRLVYGADDPRGRPADGYLGTVEGLTLDQVRQATPQLLDPGRARLVFVGDVDAATLQTELERRFAAWKPTAAPELAVPEPLIRAPSPQLAMVDRPGAPQTVIVIGRPVPGPANDLERVSRECLNSLFGVTFTSRLMRNLREEHGYTYGARSVLLQQLNQHHLYAYSAVQGEFTAAALTEFQREFDGLSTGNVSPEELDKAVETVRYDLINTAETTSSLAGALTGLTADRRPMDSIEAQLTALESVDLAGINEVARSGLFDWQSLVIVLVGDGASVIPQLEQAGFPPPVMLEDASSLP